MEDLKEQLEEKRFQWKPKDPLTKNIIKEDLQIRQVRTSKDIPGAQDTIEDHRDEAGEEFIGRKRATAQNHTWRNHWENGDILKKVQNEVRIKKGEKER